MNATEIKLQKRLTTATAPKELTLSTFIAMLQEKAKDCGGDPVVHFESYEWTDDLEDMQDLPRDFEGVEVKDGCLVIHTSKP